MLFVKVSINAAGTNISSYSLVSGSLTSMEKLLTTTPSLAWSHLSKISFQFSVLSLLFLGFFSPKQGELLCLGATEDRLR